MVRHKLTSQQKVNNIYLFIYNKKIHKPFECLVMLLKKDNV